MCQIVFEALRIQKVTKSRYSSCTHDAQSLGWNTTVHQMEEANYSQCGERNVMPGEYTAQRFEVKLGLKYPKCQ